jgi:hypothetical protein
MKMKLTIAMMTTVLATGAGAWAADPEVNVCVEAGSKIFMLHESEMMATKMYAKIGVNLTWQSHFSCEDTGSDIVVSFGDPGSKRPKILAYALPFEGRHIVVYNDRIRNQATMMLTPKLMAHVLAHEIGHMLQGVSRHSEAGLMKPVFNAHDKFLMMAKPLEFTDADAQLVLLGIEARHRRAQTTLIASR